MSLCALCGFPLSGDSALCAHHEDGHGDNWAAANRIMCDFLHRAKVPPRLMKVEREGEFWTASEVA